MKYVSVIVFAEKWNVSERTVRHYCALGKIKGAFLTGKTWNIPEEATLPLKERKRKFSENLLLNHLKEQKEMKLLKMDIFSFFISRLGV